MISSGLSLLLVLVVIFAACWVICYILQNFAKVVPGQVQSFVWLVGAIVAIIKVAMWAGL